MPRVNKHDHPDHFIKTINPSGVPDVFYNRIDRTWAEGPNPIPSVMTLGHKENAIDDGTITYVYNSDSYRSDKFTSNHDGKHVLFMGCSETEGLGSEYDTVWSKIVYDELSKHNKMSGYFNMGKAGFGWQKIISNFIQYKNRYGKPEYLFVLMPNIGRRFFWNPNEEKWDYIQSDNEVGQKNNNDPNKLLTVKAHREYFINFCIGVKFFEEYCKEAGIKLYWTTWNDLENDNFALANCFQNLFLVNEKNEFENFIEKNRPGLKLNKYDLNRRDGHHGVLYHQYWAEKFLEKIGKEL
jgi:hypothetical protein